MVSASQLSALFFIMENDVCVLEPCFLARFLGSTAAKFLLLPKYLPVIPLIHFIEICLSVHGKLVVLLKCIIPKKTVEIDSMVEKKAS